jgi:hypothetical protein
MVHGERNGSALCWSRRVLYAVWHIVLCVCTVARLDSLLCTDRLGRVPLEYRWSTAGVPLEYRWSTAGVPLEYPLSTAGVPLEYRWSTL